MTSLYTRLFVQIGDRAGHTKHAMGGPGGAVQALHGLNQQLLTLGIQLAVTVDIGAVELGVGASLTLLLMLSATGDTFAYGLGRLAGRQ